MFFGLVVNYVVKFVEGDIVGVYVLDCVRVVFGY